MYGLSAVWFGNCKGVDFHAAAWRVHRYLDEETKILHWHLLSQDFKGFGRNVCLYLQLTFVFLLPVILTRTVVVQIAAAFDR